MPVTFQSRQPAVAVLRQWQALDLPLPLLTAPGDPMACGIHAGFVKCAAIPIDQRRQVCNEISARPLDKRDHRRQRFIHIHKTSIQAPMFSAASIVVRRGLRRCNCTDNYTGTLDGRPIVVLC